MSVIHPRMPVILHTRDYDRWLDREETERLPLDLLRPYESEEMEVYEADPKVNSARNNGPEMMRVAERAALDGQLPLYFVRVAAPVGTEHDNMRVMNTFSRSNVLALLLCATANFAQSSKGSPTMYSANRLVQECRASIADYDSKQANIGSDGEHCLGYIQGLVDTAMMWQVANDKSAQARVPMFCLTPKVTNEIIIRRVPIWAIEHPKDAKGSALEFLLSMLVGSYPCPK